MFPILAKLTKPLYLPTFSAPSGLRSAPAGNTVVPSCRALLAVPAVRTVSPTARPDAAAQSEEAHTATADISTAPREESPLYLAAYPHTHTDPSLQLSPHQLRAKALPAARCAITTISIHNRTDTCFCTGAVPQKHGVNKTATEHRRNEAGLPPPPLAARSRFRAAYRPRAGARRTPQLRRRFASSSRRCGAARRAAHLLPGSAEQSSPRPAAPRTTPAPAPPNPTQPSPAQPSAAPAPRRKVAAVPWLRAANPPVQAGSAPRHLPGRSTDAHPPRRLAAERFGRANPPPSSAKVLRFAAS